MYRRYSYVNNQCFNLVKRSLEREINFYLVKENFEKVENFCFKYKSDKKSAIRRIAYSNLGYLYLLKEQYANAIKAIKSSLSLEPDQKRDAIDHGHA